MTITVVIGKQYLPPNNSVIKGLNSIISQMCIRDSKQSIGGSLVGSAGHVAVISEHAHDGQVVAQTDLKVCLLYTSRCV